MISYCGEVHQKENWDKHKEMCRILTDITRQKKLTHLYEDLRGCDLLQWIDARDEMKKKVTSLLGRGLESYESDMLQYPRSCFECFDTRQDNLINCSQCPLVSTCKRHSRSAYHEMWCSEMKYCHTIDNALENVRESLKHILGLLFYPPNFKKLPTSTQEYFDKILKPHPELNDAGVIYASTFIYLPLTIFGALQKLNLTSAKTLRIYVDVVDKIELFRIFGEAIFHMMPDLENLTVTTITGKVSCEEVALCKKCITKKRKLSLQQLTMQSMTKFNYHSIDLAIFNNLDPPDIRDYRFKVFAQFGDVWKKYSCPLVLTSNTKFEAERIASHFSLFCPNRCIIYDGRNDFAGICPYRIWQDWLIGRQSQFMLISKAINIPNAEIHDTASTSCEVENFQPSAEKIFKKFNPGTCHVCKYHNTSTMCTRCKMIFYCGNNHMKMNQSDHKEMCKVILGMMNEKGTPHLFDKLQNTNEELWLDARVNFMKQAKLKLNRELLNFEKQIFLFPKTCFVCHESDLSVLKTCKCSVSLCKIHREDGEHKNLCKDFQLYLQMESNKEKPAEPFTITAALKRNKNKMLPSSIWKFVDQYFLLKSYNAEKQKIIVSNLLTRPLTFVYAAEKLKFQVPKEICIHIVGATCEEFDHVGYWQTLFYWFSKLQFLLIDFIGNDIVEYEEVYFKSPYKLPDFSLDGKQLSLNSYRGRYDDYVKSKVYSKPDIIIGYNLGLHESNYEISECTWKETLSVISEMNVPFIITAQSEKRGRKEHEMLCSLLGKRINYEISEKNPYASLIPERDFETERLCYSNSHVMVYRNFNEVKILESVEEASTSKGKKKKKGGRGKNSATKEVNEKETDQKEECVEDFDSKAQAVVVNEELVKENVQLHEENKLLQGKLSLVQESDRLKDDLITMLKIEN